MTACKEEPDATTRVSELIQNIYSIVQELERLYPGRKFTPDGHMVGSIGEVMAARYYDLSLLPSSAAVHDARTSSGLQVQIKASQGNSISLYAEPDHLIVLCLQKDGFVCEVFNGPGELAWDKAGQRQKNGQRPIGFAKLQTLMMLVPTSRRLPSSPPLPAWIRK